MSTGGCRQVPGGFGHRRDLFIGESGRPMNFTMRPCPERAQIQDAIIHGGGQISCTFSNGCIRLAPPGTISQDPHALSYKYILACVSENRLVNKTNFLLTREVEPELDSDEEPTAVVERRPRPQPPLRSGRTVYNLAEEMWIINFIARFNLFSQVTGKTMWEKAERALKREKELTHRSWQSLKERFRKKVLPNIRSFKIPVEILNKFLFVDESHSSIKEEDRIVVSCNSNRPYSYSEDVKILNWIIEHHRIDDVKGNLLYQQMKKKGVVDRPFQSIRARFLRYIAPNLQRFKIDYAVKQRICDSLCLTPPPCERPSRRSPSPEIEEYSSDQEQLPSVALRKRPSTQSLPPKQQPSSLPSYDPGEGTSDGRRCLRRTTTAYFSKSVHDDDDDDDEDHAYDPRPAAGGTQRCATTKYKQTVGSFQDDVAGSRPTETTAAKANRKRKQAGDDRSTKSTASVATVGRYRRIVSDTEEEGEEESSGVAAVSVSPPSRRLVRRLADLRQDVTLVSGTTPDASHRQQHPPRKSRAPVSVSVAMDSGDDTTSNFASSVMHDANEAACVERTESEAAVCSSPPPPPSHPPLPSHPPSHLLDAAVIERSVAHVLKIFGEGCLPTPSFRTPIVGVVNSSGNCARAAAVVSSAHHRGAVAAAVVSSAVDGAVPPVVIKQEPPDSPVLWHVTWSERDIICSDADHPLGAEDPPSRRVRTRMRHGVLTENSSIFIPYLSQSVPMMASSATIDSGDNRSDLNVAASNSSQYFTCSSHVGDSRAAAGNVGAAGICLPAGSIPSLAASPDSSSAAGTSSTGIVSRNVMSLNEMIRQSQSPTAEDDIGGSSAVRSQPEQSRPTSIVALTAGVEAAPAPVLGNRRMAAARLPSPEDPPADDQVAMRDSLDDHHHLPTVGCEQADPENWQPRAAELDAGGGDNGNGPTPSRGLSPASSGSLSPELMPINGFDGVGAGAGPPPSRPVLHNGPAAAVDSEDDFDLVSLSVGSVPGPVGSPRVLQHSSNNSDAVNGWNVDADSDSDDSFRMLEGSASDDVQEFGDHNYARLRILPDLVADSDDTETYVSVNGDCLERDLRFDRFLGDQEAVGGGVVRNVNQVLENGENGCAVCRSHLRVAPLSPLHQSVDGVELRRLFEGLEGQSRPEDAYLIIQRLSEIVGISCCRLLKILNCGKPEVPRPSDGDLH